MFSNYTLSFQVTNCLNCKTKISEEIASVQNTTCLLHTLLLSIWTLMMLAKVKNKIRLSYRFPLIVIVHTQIRSYTPFIHLYRGVLSKNEYKSVNIDFVLQYYTRKNKGAFSIRKCSSH